MSKSFKPLKCAFSGISDPDVLRCLGYEKPNNGEYKTMMATRKKYLQSLTSGSLSNAPIRKRPSNSQKSNVGRNSRYVHNCICIHNARLVSFPRVNFS